MPNRIIKQSAFESEKIAALTDFEFRLWVGLITQADDAGRGDARPAILKGRIFALRERVTVKDIDHALSRLAAAGCVSLYTVGGKPYYAFPNWARHQRVYNAKAKTPGPEEAENEDLRESAASCGESPRVAAESRLNPNPNPNPNPKKARADALSVFAAFAGEDHDLAVALADFAQMRKSIKKPLTDRAAELICDKLTKEFRREDWIAAINQSVVNSWQGLFPLHDDGAAKGTTRKAREQASGVQQHGAPMSPTMRAAVARMLAEEVPDDG